ncbi:hypothetical protein [Maridesulfovibrio sp. FT414]|uniref:hypothetical protein n=1 Tax=Maridesulfovibrio sp. FT414 TaxID=2979469 RepID=UPI003D804D04
MKTRLFLPTLLFILFTVLPASAQDDCASRFIGSLKQVSGVKAVEQTEKGYLAILDSSDKAQSIKAVSQIKALRKSGSNSRCDYSGTAVAVMNSNLDVIKSGTADALNKGNIATMLYKYVHDLSPVEVEENLRGYEVLCEMSPANSYYAARKAHYEQRIQLIKDRNEFIAKSEELAAKDRDIIDLKIKKDFYLFVTAGKTPLATAEKFLSAVAEKTTRPEKKFCIIAYSSDLETRESDCPEEYSDALHETEEELLMRYVQSLPGYLLQDNVNGYSALKKLNPGVTLYTKKLDAYSYKLDGLERFRSLRTATGNKLISKSSTKSSTLFATVSREALQGKSASANLKLMETLAQYYQQSGAPLDRCVLKDPSGTTLGTISCSNSDCSFK